MARLDFTAKAAAAIRALPNDMQLLKAVWRYLERAADAPDDHIEPPAFPYPHPLLNFRAADTAGDEWAFTVLVRFNRRENTLLVILLHAGRVPDDIDVDELD